MAGITDGPKIRADGDAGRCDELPVIEGRRSALNVKRSAADAAGGPDLALAVHPLR